MLRLRTTVGLSLLALGIGAAGTAWLSTLTDDWRGPAGAPSARHDRVRMMLRRHARPARPVADAVPAEAASGLAPPPSPVSALPMLRPLEMPSLPTPLFEREAFASGRVVLQLSVDGEGRVAQAAVFQSSGNAGLDDRALRTVARWRFAVPADHPQGLTGQLVMRFDDTPATPR